MKKVFMAVLGLRNDAVVATISTKGNEKVVMLATKEIFHYAALEETINNIEKKWDCYVISFTRRNSSGDSIKDLAQMANDGIAYEILAEKVEK